MVVTNDKKFTWNNLGSTKFKNTSISSNNTVTSKTVTTTITSTVSDQNSDHIKPLQSMTDEEIIENNLKELMDKKHQEERKANGRLVAVILASLVIVLAIYHAWIRNSGMLAGILIPAVIMLSFGAWVVVLAKRDKAKRQVFEKYLQEVALKNKQELKAKSKSKSKSTDKKLSNNILLHYENEINNEQIPLTHLSGYSGERKTTSILKSKDHHKHRKHRRPINSDSYSMASSLSNSNKSSHYATKDLRVKRPSIRQKLFRQTGTYHMPAPNPNVTYTLVQAVINTPMPQCTPPPVNVLPIQCPESSTLLETKRKRLQRLNSLHVPTMMRMSSAP